MRSVALALCALTAIAGAQDKSKPTKPQDGPGETVAGAPQLPAAAKFDRIASYVDLILSSDSAWIYVLDIKNNKVCKLKADDLTLTAELDGIENAVAMSLTPDGKTLYVAGCDATAQVKPGSGSNWGAFQIIATAKFTVITEFKVDNCPVSDFAALDDGRLAVVCYGANKGLANTFVAVDAIRKKAITTIDITHRGTGKGNSFDRPHLHMPPEQDRVYCTGDYSFIRIEMNRGADQYDAWETGRCHGKPMGKDFSISTNGERIFSNAGSLFNTSSQRGEDLMHQWKLDLWLSCAWPKDGKTFLAVREEGKVAQYEIEAKKRIASYRLGAECLEMVYDDKRRRLITLTVPIDDGKSQVFNRSQLYELTTYKLPDK